MSYMYLDYWPVTDLVMTSDRFVMKNDIMQYCLGLNCHNTSNVATFVVVLYNPRLQLSTNEYQYLHA